MSLSARRLLLAAVLGAGVVAALSFRGQVRPEAIEAWLAQAGILGPLLFMAIYAAATVLFLPGSALTLAGGALFGPLWGTLYNLTGATLGALLAFLTARYLGAEWVRRRAGPRLGRLIHGVDEEGWRFVAFTRLVPLFPFNLLNYALGLTRIPVGQYLIATFAFMLPGAIAYTWLGYAGLQALSGTGGLIRNGLIALGLLAALAFVPRLVARLRQGPVMEVAELKRRLEAGADLIVLDVRTPEEYSGEQGHVRGALNVPLESLQARIDELADATERPIAIVCRTDRRSAKAAAVLARRGFADVHVVRGGMSAWNEAGWRVERQLGESEEVLR